MKIFKYELGRQPILMPRGAVAIYVGEQGNDIYIWMLCDPMQPGEERVFHVISTGESFDPQELTHIGTIQQDNGLVWHIFE